MEREGLSASRIPDGLCAFDFNQTLCLINLDSLKYILWFLLLLIVGDYCMLQNF